jgi:hypothetical protein
MISHKHKFIFIHIPKTGGGSLEKVFRNLDTEYNNMKLLHSPISDYPMERKHYFKFTFVRNPWDLRVSYYFYNKTQGTFRGRHARNKSFSEYVKFYSKKRKSLIARPQVYFLGRDVNNVDFIGRFENLQNDFNKVCGEVGIPRQELPHAHKTNHKHYTEYYDDETRQVVAEKYKKDIEYFGYEFGE